MNIIAPKKNDHEDCQVPTQDFEASRFPQTDSEVLLID